MPLTSSARQVYLSKRTRRPGGRCFRVGPIAEVLASFIRSPRDDGVQQFRDAVTNIFPRQSHAQDHQFSRGDDRYHLAEVPLQHERLGGEGGYTCPAPPNPTAPPHTAPAPPPAPAPRGDRA